MRKAGKHESAVTVPRVDAQISRADLTDAVESLRAVLAAIDAGEITADLDHVAYLRGAVAALTALAKECPETKVSGCGQHVATGETFPQDG